MFSYLQIIVKWHITEIVSKYVVIFSNKLS